MRWGPCRIEKQKKVFSPLWSVLKFPRPVLLHLSVRILHSAQYTVVPTFTLKSTDIYLIQVLWIRVLIWSVLSNCVDPDPHSLYRYGWSTQSKIRKVYKFFKFIGTYNILFYDYCKNIFWHKIDNRTHVTSFQIYQIRIKTGAKFWIQIINVFGSTPLHDS